MGTLAIFLLIVALFVFNGGRCEGCIKLPCVLSVIGAFKLGRLCLLAVSVPRRRNRIYYRLAIA